METGWNLAVLKNQHRFEKPRDARCGFQMAKIGFYGADGQRCVGGSIAAQSFCESMREIVLFPTPEGPESTIKSP